MSRGHDLDPCRPCTCCSSLCKFIQLLLSWFKGPCPPGILQPLWLTCSFNSVPLKFPSLLLYDWTGLVFVFLFWSPSKYLPVLATLQHGGSSPGVLFFLLACLAQIWCDFFFFALSNLLFFFRRRRKRKRKRMVKMTTVLMPYNLQASLKTGALSNVHRVK